MRGLLDARHSSEMHGRVTCTTSVASFPLLLRSAGVEGVDPADFAARTVINLDSEEWGEVTIGSAGTPPARGSALRRKLACMAAAAALLHSYALHAVVPRPMLLTSAPSCTHFLHPGDTFSSMTLDAEAQPLPAGSVPVAIDVGGLLGGHSGEPASWRAEGHLGVRAGAPGRCIFGGGAAQLAASGHHRCSAAAVACLLPTPRHENQPGPRQCHQACE